MEAATVPAPPGPRAAGSLNRLLRPLAFMSGPTAVLALLFLGADDR